MGNSCACEDRIKVMKTKNYELVEAWLEKDLVNTTEREDPFWSNLGNKMRSLLNDCCLVKRIKLKESQDEDEDEIKELKTLMEAQNEELELLLTGLDSDDTEVEPEKLKEKLTKLSRSHKELSHCIFIFKNKNTV